MELNEAAPHIGGAGNAGGCREGSGNDQHLPVSVKGVALEARTMKQIDTDSFQHIKQVRSVRGSRLPKGRALERHEIRSLFFTCESDSSAKGFGMRPFSGCSSGVACAARKSLRWTWEA